MMFLGEYRASTERLADHLPWAALVAPGVVLNKDGSFLRVLAFRGPDLESSTEAELVAATGVLTPICGPSLSGRAFQWFQTYEYVRNFLSRYAWMQAHSLLLISGAFAAFRRVLRHYGILLSPHKENV